MKRKMMAIALILSLMLTGCRSAEYSLPPLPAVTEMSVIGSAPDTPRFAVGLDLLMYFSHPVFDDFTQTEILTFVSEVYPIEVLEDETVFFVESLIREHAFSTDKGQMTLLFFSEGQPVPEMKTGAYAIAFNYRCGEAFRQEIHLNSEYIGNNLSWCVCCADLNDLNPAEWETQRKTIQFMQSGSLEILNTFSQRKHLLTEAEAFDAVTAAVPEQQKEPVWIQCTDFMQDSSDSSILHSQNGLHISVSAAFADAVLIPLIDDQPVIQNSIPLCVKCSTGDNKEEQTIHISVQFPDDEKPHRFDCLLTNPHTGEVYAGEHYLIENGDAS